MARRNIPPSQRPAITPRNGPAKPVTQPDLPRAKGDRSDTLKGNKLFKGRKP